MEDKSVRAKPKETPSILPVLLAALFMTFTFCVFGPLVLYVTNYTELFFSVKDIWWICLLVGVVILALLVGIGALLKRHFRAWYICLLFGGALALYVQGNWVTTDYGVMNGEINWAAYSSLNLTNTLLWLVCLAIPFVLRKVLPKVWRPAVLFGSAAVLLIEVATLGVLFATTDFTEGIKSSECSFTKQGEFELSKNDNTLVFILDCYDSSEFQIFDQNHPAYQETLWKDFTYYPNTVAGATRTILALPYILSGQPYTNEDAYSHYLNTAYEQAPVYETLKELDYSTGIYTDSSFAAQNLGDTVMNLSGESKQVTSHTKLAYYLYRFTACRYLPHILKERVWMYSDDFNNAAVTNERGDGSTYVIDDAAFYSELKENGLQLSSDGNAFRLYHLNGAHPPYTLTADSRHAVGEVTSDEQQKGVWNILETYFDEMRAAGIYDNANIIIMADHGGQDYEQNPLLMIKCGTQTRQFTQSDAPVSYVNFQPTLLSLVGKNDTGIKSIFELEKGDNAQRLFYRQENRDEKDIAVEYVIEGDAQDLEKIHATGKEFSIFSSGEATPVNIGSTLFFDSRATGTPYIVSGFSKNEGTHTWTSDPQATLTIPLAEKPTTDLFVTITTAMRMKDHQRVGVSVNGTPLHYYQLDSSTLSFRIPLSAITDQEISLQLDMPDAVSPSETTQTSGDSRKLSLGFYSLKIEEAKSGDVETATAEAPQ